jgi:hypothetical protein
MLRRSILAISAGVVLCVSTALSGAALASPASGVKGDPQPDHKPFQIAGASTAGGITLSADGVVVAYAVTATHNKIVVCPIKPGGRKCSFQTVITTPDSGTLEPFGVTGVFHPSANHIAVLQNTCCDTATDGDTLLYTSTDNGKTFGAPVRVGNLGVGASVLIGNDIVFTASDVAGTHVESIPVSASGPPASTATLTTAQAVDVGIGDDHGAVLEGFDILTTDYTTHIYYAPTGSNFDLKSSYRDIATFNHEQLMGVSGDAVLTRQTTGKQRALLRFCTSRGCSTAHQVPGPDNPGPNAFGIAQDQGGVTHVFSSGGYASGPLYDLIDLSTSNGTHWSNLDLGDAINSTSFTAALNSRGAGMVLGSTPAWAYPVFIPQAVSFSLKSSSIKKGQSTVGSGHVSPAFLGLAVALQVERSHSWYTVATTHESKSGAFSFKIKGSTTGTFHYRAVASDLVGEFLYGYSPARALTVKK